MKLYHVTSPEAADAIEANGFRDACGSYMTDREFRGVWVSDRPLDGGNDMGDDSAIFEIELDEPLIEEFEWIEEGKGYREWLVPASLLNQASRRRVDEEDIRED